MPILRASLTSMMCSTLYLSISMHFHYFIRYKRSTSFIKPISVGTGTSFFATKLRYTKFSTLSIRTIDFNELRLFEEDPNDGRGLREVRAESRSALLVSLVSKYFCSPDAEAYSGTKIGKYIELSTTFSVPGKQNRTPTMIDVDVETPVEPCKSSRVANLFRKGPSSCQIPKAGLLPPAMTKLLQTTKKRKTAEEHETWAGCVWWPLTQRPLARLQCRLQVCEVCISTLDSQLPSSSLPS